MKNLKTYRMFESVMELTQEQINWLDECAEGTWTLNPQTGLVDVKGKFNCSEQGLTDLKGVRFGEVSDDFCCHNNQLTTLEGAPQKVRWYFFCHKNQLTTLKGAPKTVHNFFCDENQLTSLVGAPQTLRGNFTCDGNQLTSLEGAPQTVGGFFRCEDNQLTTLEGAPQTVVGHFACHNNQLTTLEGAPQKVGADFACHNNALTSLEGAPQEVGGDFDCDNNPVSRETLKTIFTKMQQGTSYLAAVESLWSEIPLDDQALLYADDFKWVSPEQSRGIVALRAYQGLRGML